MPIRETRQRKAIQKAFASKNRALSPKEIVAIASESVPNLGIATVYRNIKSMVEDGELEVVEIPGQAARYCLPEGRTTVVFVCGKSDRVFFLDAGLAKVDFKCVSDRCKVHRTEVILHGELLEEES